MRISPYLEDSSIDVDEGNRGQGNVEEFLLPAIRVNLRRKMKAFNFWTFLSHLDHDASEGKAENDKDKADEKPAQARISWCNPPIFPKNIISKKPGKCAEPVSHNPIQDEEGDIGHHTGENEFMTQI